MDGGSPSERGGWKGAGLGVALACLALFIALTPASARKPDNTVTADATVVSVAVHRSDFCSDNGIIRWTAVKGVDSYTVLFNDAAYGGAEQSVSVAEPWPDDAREPAGSPLNAPSGTHQLNWTGIYGSPPCGEPVDYSGRLTNARVKYVREGAYIDGRITTPPCVEDPCASVEGIKVTAKGEETKSDSTDATGRYSIKVKKGSYSVVPKGAGLEFQPGKRVVSVGRSGSAQADFTLVPNVVPPHPLAVATLESLKGRGDHLPMAEVFRNGKWQKLRKGGQLRVGDKIRTDANTEAAFEFAIGGRVGIRPGSTVDILSESSSNDDVPRVKLTKGAAWAKCQKLKEPLEIQVSAGVMGIRG